MCGEIPHSSTFLEWKVVVSFSLCFQSTATNLSLLSCSESYTFVFPQISLSHTRNDRMIHKNIPKSPTQQLAYRTRHLVDVRKPEGDREMERERERGPQSSDKNVRNGQRWMDFQHYIMKTYLLFSIQTPHALTHCSLHTLSSPWRYLSHPLLLSHKAFSAEPCRCSPSHRWPNRILTFQQTSLIIILGVNELRSSLNWVYLPNQIGPIKTKLLLTLHNWVFTLQTYFLMFLSSLCSAYYFVWEDYVCKPAEIWVLLDVISWIDCEEHDAKLGMCVPIKPLHWIKYKGFMSVKKKKK